jgi:hypothetical protein
VVSDADRFGGEDVQGHVRSFSWALRRVCNGGDEEEGGVGNCD